MTEFERQALLDQRTWVRRLAERIVYDSGDVDDVVQDTYVAALQQPEAPGRGWFVRTIRNLALTRSRARKRRRQREQRVSRREAEPGTADVVKQAESQRVVVDAVLALAEPYRTTILLRYYEDLPPRRIAARQGVPVATVKTRLVRARERLRASLDNRSRRRGAWMAVLAPMLRAPAAAGVGGLVMGKKTVAVAAVALLLATAAFWPRPTDPEPRTDSTDRRTGRATAAEGPATSEPATKPRAAVRHSGRVIDREGEPVAGARVHLVANTRAQPPIWGPTSFERLRTTIENARTARAPEPDAVTGAEGKFSVVTGTRHAVLVCAAGFLARVHAIPADLPIILEKREPTSGVVVDPDGSAVQGAAVHLLVSDARLGRTVCVARARTGADGRFAFANEAAGAELLVEHESYPPTFFGLGRGKEAVVRLTNWADVHGTVIDEATRRPIAGATVHVAGIFGGRAPPWGTTTEADGSFRLRHGLAGPYGSVVADAGPRGNREERIQLPATGPIEIRLRPAVALRGRITGPPPGERGGLRIVCSQNQHFVSETRTDEHGGFELKGVTPGTKAHILFDPWHSTWETDGDTLDRAVGPPFPELTVLNLRRKAVVEGRVVDGQGRSVAGAILECREGHSHSFGPLLVLTYPRVQAAVTGPDGSFRLEGVTNRDSPLPISIRAGGFVLGRLDLEALTPGETRRGVVVRLDRGLSIRGRVEFADGTPAPSVLVLAGREQPGQMPPFDYVRATTRTNADGEYELLPLPPGRYAVSVLRQPRYAPAWARADAGTRCKTIVLRQAHELRGVVRDGKGRLLASATVSVHAADFAVRARVRTDALGRFVASQLAPGVYTVQCWLPGRLNTLRKGVVVPRPEPLAITLRRGASIRGVVLDAAGRLLPGRPVSAERQGASTEPGSSGQAITDQSGRFEIAGLGSGRFKVTVGGSPVGDTAFRTMRDVASGTEITIRGERGSFLNVLVSGSVESPQVTVVAQEPKGGKFHARRTGPGGGFRAGPLLGERFTVVAFAGGVLGFAPDVAAGTKSVTVTLGDGHEIAGRIETAGGKPANGTVALTPKTLPHFTLHIPVRQKDGAFRITGLSEGEYWIRATGPWVVAYGPSGKLVRSGATGLVLTLAK